MLLLRWLAHNGYLLETGGVSREWLGVFEEATNLTFDSGLLLRFRFQPRYWSFLDLVSFKTSDPECPDLVM